MEDELPSKNKKERVSGILTQLSESSFQIISRNELLMRLYRELYSDMDDDEKEKTNDIIKSIQEKTFKGMRLNNVLGGIADKAVRMNLQNQIGKIDMGLFELYNELELLLRETAAKVEKAEKTKHG